MAKQPDLKTVDDGWYETSDFNFNFKSIQEAFRKALWRTARDGESTPEVPNQMDVDLDVSDANITNVRQLDVNQMNVAGVGFEGFGEQYLFKLNELNCDSGEILTHDADGDPICLEAGDDGEVLKTVGSLIDWAEDIDTDEDTVGVTVQEDGVTVAENVTTIDFLWSDSVLVTTPAADQADVDLRELLLTTLYEDTRDTNDNLTASADDLWGTSSHIKRVDLGLDTNGDGQYYAIMEANNYFLASGSEAPGTWAMSMRFYDNTGTAGTPNSGNSTGLQQGFTDSTAGGALITLKSSIPDGTRFVDFYWSLLAVSPINLTTTDVCGRYVAVFPGTLNGVFETPEGRTDTAAAGPLTCPL